MTDADKIMSPQHFGSDLANIRIRINPEIRIRTPDSFRLRFWPWRSLALSDHNLVHYSSHHCTHIPSASTMLCSLLISGVTIGPKHLGLRQQCLCSSSNYVNSVRVCPSVRLSVCHCHIRALYSIILVFSQNISWRNSDGISFIAMSKCRLLLKIRTK